MDDVTLSQDPSLVTPGDGTQLSSTPDSGNEGNPISNQEPDAGIDYKKRYQDSSKEAMRLKEEAERFKREAEEARQELLGTVTKSRDTFEEYINSKGLLPHEKERYMNIYDSQIAPTLGSAKSNNAAQEVTDTLEGTPSPSTPINMEPTNPFREQWMNRMDSIEREKILAQAEATKNFFSREENVKLPDPVKDSIRATARMLDEVYGYKPSEALEMARKRLLSPDEISDEGYVRGIADAFQGGINGGFAGGATVHKDTVKLPPKHEQWVQSEIARRGLSGDAARKYREMYAKKLAR